MAKIPAGIITSDETGVIDSFNPAAEQIFGFDAEEVLGRYVTMLMPANYAAAHQHQLDRYLRTGKAKILGGGAREVAGRRKNGEGFPIDLATSEMVIGGRLCLIAAVRDVTDRAALEGKLLEAKDEADRADRAKSDFLISMSHEIRTPLNAIIGFADLLAAQFGGSLNGPQKEYVGDIRQAGDLLLSIINGVLELSKIELGKLDLKPQLTDIADLIHKTARLISSQAIGSGVAVRVEVTPGLPEVFVDPHSLQQILLNLLSNACKFTPVGGRVLIRGRRGQGRWGLGNPCRRQRHRHEARRPCQSDGDVFATRPRIQAPVWRHRHRAAPYQAAGGASGRETLDRQPPEQGHRRYGPPSRGVLDLGSDGLTPGDFFGALEPHAGNHADAVLGVFGVDGFFRGAEDRIRAHVQTRLTACANLADDVGVDADVGKPAALQIVIGFVVFGPGVVHRAADNQSIFFRQFATQSRTQFYAQALVATAQTLADIALQPPRPGVMDKKPAQFDAVFDGRGVDQAGVVCRFAAIVQGEPGAGRGLAAADQIDAKSALGAGEHRPAPLDIDDRQCIGLAVGAAPETGGDFEADTQVDLPFATRLGPQ